MKRQETIQVLLQNMEAIGRAMASRKVEHPVGNMPTHAQLGVLMVVSYQGPQGIKSLADRFCMTSSGVTQLVNGLVTEGLISRVGDKKDRRKLHLQITSKGKRTLALAREQRVKNMLNIFGSLSDTELSQLQKIQRKIMQRLQTLWVKGQSIKKFKT